MENQKHLDGAEFSKQILAAHQRMRMLVLAIAPACDEIDDVVQEACSAMWNKLDRFDPDQPFQPWAMTFVRFQTMAWLKKRGRNKIRLSNETIDQLCDTIESGGQDNDRVEALELCLSGLSDSEQKLLAMRFVDGLTVQEIANLPATESGGKSADSLYKHFARLKASLLQCIESRLEFSS